jgi:hypothetical protein
MKPRIASVLAMVLAFAVPASHANAPDPAYEQTRDWVVATISEYAGYAADSAVITYKDVSMDACQLRFTTVTATPATTDSATFVVSLDSVNSVLWGQANDPVRGYVLFTTTRPIRFSKENAGYMSNRQFQIANASTAVAALEFGKPNSDVGETASHMRAALLRASNLCKVQLAAK